MVKRRGVLTQMPLGFDKRSGSLPDLGMLEVGFHHAEHTGCSLLLLAFGGGIVALGDFGGELAGRASRRFERHGRDIAECDPPRALMLVAILVNPSPTSGGQGT
jgi:hypothetical protein